MSGCVRRQRRRRGTTCFQGCGLLWCPCCFIFPKNPGSLAFGRLFARLVAISPGGSVPIISVVVVVLGSFHHVSIVGGGGCPLAGDGRGSIGGPWLRCLRPCLLPLHRCSLACRLSLRRWLLIVLWVGCKIPCGPPLGPTRRRLRMGHLR